MLGDFLCELTVLCERKQVHAMDAELEKDKKEVCLEWKFSLRAQRALREKTGSRKGRKARKGKSN